MNSDGERGQARDLAFEGTLLPPPAGVCQVCASDHPPDEMHDRESLYYQYRFYQQQHRWPTWSDAMAHCTPERQREYVQALEELGVPQDQIVRLDVR